MCGLYELDIIYEYRAGKHKMYTIIMIVITKIWTQMMMIIEIERHSVEDVVLICSLMLVSQFCNRTPSVELSLE